ncbi:berberine family [Fusarium longipes]|uniref:Berberine family n=1 Tax=Fusarium longipes TaxID=694270 RepID=A0A395RR47_9HYPO|nr:berberine family [Fusarium longipes]
MPDSIDTVYHVLKLKEVELYQRDDQHYGDYEKLVVTSNLLFRFSRPRCIVKPRSTVEVQTVIEQSKKQNVRLTIRCGGHSYAGFSTALETNNDILMDLRNMNTVELDALNDTVTIGAGCQWGEVYRCLINNSLDGRIINGGRCPWVGVGGFMLGSGLGPFTRTLGMGSDTLLGAAIVTADGEVVTVAKDDDFESKEGQLFWALQGAGQANFGVVTQMKLKVERLKSGGTKVVGGRFQWFPKDNNIEELRNTMNDLYKAKWPERITIDTTWICDLREKTSDGVRFTVYYDGRKEDYDKLIDKYVKHEDVNKQLKKRALEEPSTRFLYETLERQWFDESKRFFAENKSYRIFAAFAFDRRQIKSNVDKITAILQQEMKSFRELYTGENVNLDIVWIHTGGKASDRKPQDTAYYWRRALYHTYIEILWEDKWMELNMRGFMAKLKKKLRPYSLNKAAAFVNFPDRELAKGAYERVYFGENRHKLRKVKETWDKDNYFSWAQSIQLPKDAVDDVTVDVDMEDYENQTDRLAQDLWHSSNWQHRHIQNFDVEMSNLESLAI